MAPRTPIEVILETEAMYLKAIEEGHPLSSDKVAAGKGIPTALSIVADKLGITTGMVRIRLKDAAKYHARKGHDGYDPVLDGFEITKTSVQIGEYGETQKQWVTQKPERGEVFEVPAGHKIKGVSALVDGDNRVIAQWMKTKDEPDPDEIIEQVQKAFENFQPKAPSIIRTAGNEDKLSTYIWTDWHVGLHAWGRETDGADWDLGIARKALTRTHEELVDEMPKSDTALILGLGDLCHIDNMKGVTSKSNNIMDHDTRYPKIHDVATEICIENFEQIRRKHRKVKAAFKRGNHDEVFTVSLRSALKMYYRNDPNVEIDQSPSPYYCERFGINLIGGVHADEVKPEALPLYMAQMWPTEWAATKTRHWHSGHVHHDHMREYGGVPVYSHRAPVPKDAWHAMKAYLSGRSMKGFKYDLHLGFRGANEVEIY